MTDERIFNVHEAKTHFSRLLAMVQAGEDVVIAKAGRPIARVVPIQAQKPRLPDAEAGVGGLWVAEDFDAALPPDLLDAFEGRG